MSLIDLFFIPFIVFAVIVITSLFLFIPITMYSEAKELWSRGHKIEAIIIFSFVGSIVLVVVGCLLARLKGLV